MKFTIWSLTTILVAASLAGVVSAAAPMLDPAKDDPARPWCFLDKSTTVIGVPYMPDVTQVTFDGALYTREAELCFFYGRPLKPLLARQKTHLDGWIPIVQYDWIDGPIRYDIEMFGAVLDGEDALNTCQFVKLTMRNVPREDRTLLARAVWGGFTVRDSGTARESSDSRFVCPVDAGHA